MQMKERQKLIKPFIKKPLKLSFRSVPPLPQKLEPRKVVRLQLPNRKSRHYGVQWIPGKQQWRAMFSHNSKSIFVGYFQTETEAAKAVDDRLEEFGLERRKLSGPIQKPPIALTKPIDISQPKWMANVLKTTDPIPNFLDSPKWTVPMKKRSHPGGPQDANGSGPHKKRRLRRQKLIHYDKTQQDFASKHSTVTRFVGVNRCNRDGGKFRASLYWKGQKKHCGMHDTELDAALAINQRCRMLGIELKNPGAEEEYARLLHTKQAPKKKAPQKCEQPSQSISARKNSRTLHLPLRAAVSVKKKKRRKAEFDDLKDSLETMEQTEYCNDYFEDGDFAPEDECSYEEDLASPNEDWEPNEKSIAKAPAYVAPTRKSYMRRNKSSRHKGVSYYKQRGVWEAYLHIPHKHHIGYYEYEKQAAEAVLNAEKHVSAQQKKGIPMKDIFPVKSKKLPEITWSGKSVKQPVVSKPVITISMPNAVLNIPSKVVGKDLLDMRIINNQTQYKITTSVDSQPRWVNAGVVEIPEHVIRRFELFLQNVP